jgi:hypothetical protein
VWGWGGERQQVDPTQIGTGAAGRPAAGRSGRRRKKERKIKAKGMKGAVGLNEERTDANDPPAPVPAPAPAPGEQRKHEGERAQKTTECGISSGVGR